MFHLQRIDIVSKFFESLRASSSSSPPIQPEHDAELSLTSQRNPALDADELLQPEDDPVPSLTSRSTPTLDADEPSEDMSEDMLTPLSQRGTNPDWDQDAVDGARRTSSMDLSGGKRTIPSMPSVTSALSISSSTYLDIISLTKGRVRLRTLAGCVVPGDTILTQEKKFGINLVEMNRKIKIEGGRKVIFQGLDSKKRPWSSEMNCKDWVDVERSSTGKQAAWPRPYFQTQWQRDSFISLRSLPAEALDESENEPNKQLYGIYRPKDAFDKPRGILKKKLKPCQKPIDVSSMPKDKSKKRLKALRRPKDALDDPENEAKEKLKERLREKARTIQRPDETEEEARERLKEDLKALSRELAKTEQKQEDASDEPENKSNKKLKAVHWPKEKPKDVWRKKVKAGWSFMKARLLRHK